VWPTRQPYGAVWLPAITRHAAVAAPPNLRRKNELRYLWRPQVSY